MRTDKVFSVLTTLTMTTLLLLSVLFFSGCHHRSTPEDRADFMIDCITGRLDLDESQKTYLQSVKDEMIAMRKEMNSSRGQVKDELITQIKNDTFDTTRLETLMQQKRVEMEKMIQLFKNRMVTFHATLKPEQKEKLVDMIESFHDRHQDHWNGA